MEVAYMYNFAIWLITIIMVTWGMYFTVYRSIKKFQNEVRYKGLKFIILLVFTWIVVGLFIVTENQLTQNIIMVVGLIILLFLYSLFFVIMGDGGDKED